MVVLHIEQVGDFMNKLLLRDVFDGFDFINGDVTTFAAFTIDGRLHRDFYSSDEQEAAGSREFAAWSEMKPRVLGLIRGKNTPLSFHFVLRLSDRNTAALLQRGGLEELLPQVEGLYLNIRFKGGELDCVTGVSCRTFLTGKDLDFLWDRAAAHFLSQSGIASEVR